MRGTQKNQQNKPKKVLFLITKSNWGGAQRYVYDLATNLDRSQFEPVVALGGNGTLADMLHHAGVRTIPIKSLNRDIDAKKEFQLARELYHTIRQERPDVLHLNSSKAGALGALIGRIALVPRIIFTAHGWAFNEDRPFWQRFIIKTIHATTVLLAHHTIAVSREMAKEMNWPSTRKKMSVVNPGRSIGAMFDRVEARAKIVDFFPHLLPYQHDTWIVTVAELHPIKRHTVLFEAIRQLTKTEPTVRLLCFGDGQLRQTLETWITTHGMEEHIFVLGSLHEAARFLRAADIFALVSKSESYGYVIHEAGLAAVPIVATKVGGVTDIIKTPTEGILVKPEDTRAITEALGYYINNPDIAAEHAANVAHSLAARTVESMVQKTTALYETAPYTP